MCCRPQYLFFNFPEWQIYGGIGMAVMAICVLCVIGYSNSSYMWTRVCFFLWPIILIAVAVRAAVMCALGILSRNRLPGIMSTDENCSHLQCSS